MFHGSRSCSTSVCTLQHVASWDTLPITTSWDTLPFICFYASRAVIIIRQPCRLLSSSIFYAANRTAFLHFATNWFLNHKLYARTKPDRFRHHISTQNVKRVRIKNSLLVLLNKQKYLQPVNRTNAWFYTIFCCTQYPIHVFYNTLKPKCSQNNFGTTGWFCVT